MLNAESESEKDKEGGEGNDVEETRKQNKEQPRGRKE